MRTTSWNPQGPARSPFNTLSLWKKMKEVIKFVFLFLISSPPTKLSRRAGFLCMSCQNWTGSNFSLKVAHYANKSGQVGWVGCWRMFFFFFSSCVAWRLTMTACHWMIIQSTECPRIFLMCKIRWWFSLFPEYPVIAGLIFWFVLCLCSKMRTLIFTAFLHMCYLQRKRVK